MSSTSLLLHHLVVILHSAVTALAAPSASTDGGDVTTTRRGSSSPRDAVLQITSTGAVTMSDATLEGYDAVEDQWFTIAKLNEGEDIVLTADVGFGQKVFDVLAFDRLAVVGTFTGTVTVKVKPLENIS